ncbi:hypothetical protein [Bacillus sp. FJAT-29937]|uniref:hypothetical protein n=1 Tax=Bacillus sp. FJAT-29937 TaxID=1720553 RepID=UPI00082C7CAB|nr:hypothetical protein [Bacillus sp. FJAT-29937]
MNLNEAIILALNSLGGEGTIEKVANWVEKEYPNRWKDIGTALADMVPESLGGNSTSNTKEEFRILEKVSRGRFRLIRNNVNNH